MREDLFFCLLIEISILSLSYECWHWVVFFLIILHTVCNYSHIRIEFVAEFYSLGLPPSYGYCSKTQQHTLWFLSLCLLTETSHLCGMDRSLSLSSYNARPAFLCNVNVEWIFLPYLFLVSYLLSYMQLAFLKTLKSLLHHWCILHTTCFDQLWSCSGISEIADKTALLMSKVQFLGYALIYASTCL
jgi:hypothetical protein